LSEFISTKWDKRFLNLARLVSEWSKDPSTKVGAVITMNRVLVSVGYNGFPQSMPDDQALYDNREEKYSRIVHAEINALLFARQPVIGATLYTWPFLSCDRCCVQMLQAGIQRFVAPEPTEEQLERWGPALKRTKQYITEANRQFATYISAI
jgi:dCMP deaminase